MKHPKSLLILDDDHISNYLTTVLIKSLGSPFPYFIATNANEALDYLKKLDENIKVLVFLDIHMPVLDGFEFLEFLGNSSEVRMKNYEFVIFSSSITHLDIAKAKSFGIQKFLSKPLLKEEIAKILNEFKKI